MARKLSRIFFTLMLVVSIFSITNVVAASNLFKLSKIKVVEKTDGTEVKDVSIKNGSINNEISFTNKNDSIIYEVTIKNVSNNDITLKSISDDNDSDYLQIGYDDVEGTVVKKGEEASFAMGILYKNEVSNNAVISNKKLNLSITYEAPDGTIGQEVLGSTENPNTGDNIRIYILIGVVALTGLIISFVSKKKINKKLLVVGISIVLLPMGVSALSDKFVITFNNNIKTNNTVTITFDSAGGSRINSVTIPKGTKLTEPSAPTKEGKTFDGWCTNTYCEETFDFDTPINSDIELHAKWVKLINVTLHSGRNTFIDGTTEKQAVFKKSEIEKYSYTQNINSDGIKQSDYLERYNRINILGTDRGDTSKPHVVSIKGASKLSIKIFTNGYYDDKVLLLKGNRSDFTYDMISDGSYFTNEDYNYYLQRYNTRNFTFKGKTIEDVYVSNLEMNGDTITFDFAAYEYPYAHEYSDNKYGYYAIVRPTIEVVSFPQNTSINGSYHSNYSGCSPSGWGYVETETYIGEERVNFNDLEEDTDLYPVWTCVH